MHDYDGNYKRLIDRALALEPGADFSINQGEGSTYGGLFEKRTKPTLAVTRIRVKMHQFGQAKRKKIRVRLEPDGTTVQIYRGR